MAYLNVRVSPGARQDAIIGWRGDPSTGSGQAVLRVRVRAAAERGKANQAVCQLLAELLGIPASRVAITRGETSRDKLLLIEGLSEEDLRRRLPKT